MATAYRPLYEEAKRLNRQKDQQISKLEQDLAKVTSDLESEKEGRAADTEEHETQVTELGEEKEGITQELKDLKTDLKTTSDQLRTKELGRFASEYEKQENNYEKQQGQWFTRSLIAGGVLMAAVAGTVATFDASINISQRPDLVVLNLVLFTAFIYSLRQHSHVANLRDDFANRKALAQSYQYMVESADGENYTEIQETFFAKATDVFTRRPSSRGNDVTLHDAVIARIFGPKS